MLVVDGEQDHATNDAFHELLMRLVDENPGHIVTVNMEAVPFMDSTALGTLIAATKRAALAGGDVLISRPSRRVASVLQETGTARLFRVHPS